MIRNHKAAAGKIPEALFAVTLSAKDARIHGCTTIIGEPALLVRGLADVIERDPGNVLEPAIRLAMRRMEEANPELKALAERAWDMGKRALAAKMAGDLEGEDRLETVITDIQDMTQAVRGALEGVKAMLAAEGSCSCDSNGDYRSLLEKVREKLLDINGLELACHCPGSDDGTPGEKWPLVLDDLIAEVEAALGVKTEPAEEQDNDVEAAVG